MRPYNHIEAAQKKRKGVCVESTDNGLQKHQKYEYSATGPDSIYNGSGVSSIWDTASIQASLSQNNWSDAPAPVQQLLQYQPAASFADMPANAGHFSNSNRVLLDTAPSSSLYTPLPQADAFWAPTYPVAASESVPMATIDPAHGFSTESLGTQYMWQGAYQDSIQLGPDAALQLPLPTSLSHMAIKFDEIVCFGVIGDINGKCEPPSSAKSSTIIEATLTSSERFLIHGSPGVQGYIAADHSFLLQDILGSGIHLRVRCTFESDGRSKQCIAEKRKLLSCQLSIAIYAPFSMLEEVKEWSEHNGVYLQDPSFCLQDAKYCNPQRLSLHFDKPRMVSQVLQQFSEHKMRLRNITEDDDFLDKYLASKVALQETEQPSAIKTALKSHQKQALTFMLRREIGWALHGPEIDMWSILDDANGRFYINAVSESGGKEPPPAFYGGVIADPMGLGKTLTMIALAATDLTKSVDYGDAIRKETITSEPLSVSATLIIVPPPLLRVWENQLSDHIHPGALSFARHHAKSRVTSMSDLNGVHVVLTTYHTVSAEWSETGKSSFLFSVKWKRIVLDEAHVIRNEASRMSKAMCSLDAECRWAVTGTPIQNHLNDLAALLKFIRAYPYESRKRFEADISDYWKEGKAQEAAARLQRLSSCLFLRRPKSTIQLPPRYNKEYPVDFTPREREEYDLMKNGAASAIDDALQEGVGSHRSGAYANILQQIESLRLFCGLGLLFHTRRDQGSIASHHASSWDSVAQRMFKLHLEMGSLRCSQCHATIDLAQTMFDDSTAGVPLFSRCLKFACAECAAKLARRRIAMPCGHTPSCPAAQVSTSIDAMDQASDDQVPMAVHPTQMPSKIVALISDLNSQPAHVKSVVFSTWRLTLNVVAAGLDQAGIQYLRFDGSIQQKDRHEILERFKKDPLKRVLLLTFSCGAVGLTLTEATRAYLLEPHWNPTIEEQALGRIYRIGQDKEVTTIRLFVRDSFETYVMKVQQSKKDLAQVILAPHDGGMADATLEKLQNLRSLL